MPYNINKIINLHICIKNEWNLEGYNEETYYKLKSK